MSETTTPKLILERRVSFAVAITLVVQTAAALMWAGGAGERLAQVERHQVEYDRMAERTARLETQISYIRESLARIEHKLDEAIIRETDLSKDA